MTSSFERLHETSGSVLVDQETIKNPLILKKKKDTKKEKENKTISFGIKKRIKSENNSDKQRKTNKKQKMEIVNTQS